MPIYLVAESETPEEREERRASAGKSAGESFAATLGKIAPQAEVDLAYPSEEDAEPFDTGRLARYDAVFLSGSPMHVYDDRPDVRRQLAFMRAVFASGTPAFGSCAGLQVAVAAAGGTIRKMPHRMEAGIARRIGATAEGRGHPMLAGRPTCWDAPSVHGDEVARLPAGARLLATSGATRVQAVEIRHDIGIFWGVQYHPELTPGEIGAALRRQSASLIEEGLAADEADVDAYARRLDALERNPDDGPARWLLGVDDEFAHEDGRRREICNFLVAAPRLKRRG